MATKKNEKKEKKSKKIKMIGYKKFPKFYKQKYTEKQFAKYLSYIQIPEDKEFFQSLFVLDSESSLALEKRTEKKSKSKAKSKAKNNENKKSQQVYIVPKDLQLSKKDISRCKLIALDLDSHGSRVKWGSLIAVVVVIAAIVVSLCFLKNPITKKVLTTAGEKVFEAKTDIRTVDVSFFKGQIHLEGLAIGNKDNVMTNIFEADIIDVDFNLTQALRGKFDAENLEVSGMAFGTVRKTSCALTKTKTEKKSSKSSKSDKDESTKSSKSDKSNRNGKNDKKDESKKSEKNNFMASLEQKKTDAISSVKELSTDLLGGTDVDSIVENLQSRLQTMQIAKDATQTAENLVSKWQGTPSELKTQVDDFSESVKSLQTINVNSLKDVVALQDALSKINTATTTSKSLIDSAQKITDEIKTDSEVIGELSASVSTAVKADKTLVSEKLGSVANVVSNAKTIFSSAIDSVGYSVLGKWYPYAQKAVSKAYEMKVNSAKKDAELKANGELTKAEKKKAKKEAEKAKKEAKEKWLERDEGTTFWYTKENPAFLIEHAKASGSGFVAEAFEITSDQDVRGKPMAITGSLNMNGATHKADFVVDARSFSSEPLIQLSYDGSNVKTSFDGTSVATSSGVPSLDGILDMKFKAKFDSNYFSGSGNVSMNQVSLYSDGFTNEIATKYYNQALSSVKNLNFAFDTGYTSENGCTLNLKGNFADVFSKSFQLIVSSIGNDAKKEAMAKLNETINDSNNEYLASAKAFLGLENEINLQNANLASIQKTLENKKAEIENEIKRRTEEATNKAINEATNAASSKVNEALGNTEAGQAASDLIKNAPNLFKKGL